MLFHQETLRESSSFRHTKYVSGAQFHGFCIFPRNSGRCQQFKEKGMYLILVSSELQASQELKGILLSE